jgi:hypothetical protein
VGLKTQEKYFIAAILGPGQIAQLLPSGWSQNIPEHIDYVKKAMPQSAKSRWYSMRGIKVGSPQGGKSKLAAKITQLPNYPFTQCLSRPTPKLQSQE